MGIPGLFKWLENKYKKKIYVLQEEQNINIINNIDGLYLDGNCCIHPQCFKILDNVRKNNIPNEIERLEELMCTRIIEYFDYLIDYVNPKEFIYISIDGVAPYSKIQQQRRRRYKAINDNKLIDIIKMNNNINTGNVNWSNIDISPGTKFMEKLHLKIIKHYENKKKYKYIYSSYHTHGEGEHKILQHLKKNYSNNDINKKFVIYGLDADLIFLSFASNINNIYLLREESHFNNNNNDNDIFEKLLYVSIDKVKLLYCNEIKMLMNFNTDNIPNQNFINDLIFICFLIGNDFLPHIPSIDIKQGGLEILLETYVSIYSKYRCNIIYFEHNNVMINDIFFKDFLEYISKKENYFFTTIKKKYDIRNENKKCNKTTNYEIDLWNLENMKTFKINDPIKLGIGKPNEWKNRYYQHYFNINNINNINNKNNNFIDNICINYLEGILWNTKYYFEKCTDWKWAYKYNHSPFISDISKFYSSYNNYTINTQIIPKNHISIFEQLLSVVPPQYKNILPNSYRSLMSNSNIIDMFPSKISIDMINKDQYFKCVPIIPLLDHMRIYKEIEHLYLSDDEIIRNTEFDDIYF
jgi:5'-3' exonuclease